MWKCNISKCDIFLAQQGDWSKTRDKCSLAVDQKPGCGAVRCAWVEIWWAVALWDVSIYSLWRVQGHEEGVCSLLRSPSGTNIYTYDNEMPCSPLLWGWGIPALTHTFHSHFVLETFTVSKTNYGNLLSSTGFKRTIHSKQHELCLNFSSRR